jgi:hypothetical protein
MQQSISVLLKKYETLIPSDRSLKECISLEASKILESAIPTSAVTVRNGVVSILVSPAARSELLLHKRQLLAAIAAKGIVGFDVR